VGWRTSINQEDVVNKLERARKKVVGEPYEGKPHVQFEVAGNGNQDMVVVLRHSQEETESNELLHLSLRRHSLTLQADPPSALICGAGFGQFFSGKIGLSLSSRRAAYANVGQANKEIELLCFKSKYSTPKE